MVSASAALRPPCWAASLVMSATCESRQSGLSVWRTSAGTACRSRAQFILDCQFSNARNLRAEIVKTLGDHCNCMLIESALTWAWQRGASFALQAMTLNVEEGLDCISSCQYPNNSEDPRRRNFQRVFVPSSKATLRSYVAVVRAPAHLRVTLVKIRLDLMNIMEHAHCSD